VVLQPAISTMSPVPAPAVPLPVSPVRAGSHYDAKRLRALIQEALRASDRLDDRVRVLCQTAREKAIYKMLQDPTGAYFASWSDFCTAPAPWGLGLHEGLLAEVAREQTDPKRRARLVLERPLLLRHRGGQSGHLPTRPQAGQDLGRPPAKRRPISGADYQLQRLKRDFPELLQQVADGTLPSIAAAAARAGLHRPKLRVLANPMAVARLVVVTFDAAGQREIVDLILDPRRITAPPGAHSAAWKAYHAATTTPEERAREEAERTARRTATCERWEARRRASRTAEHQRARRATGT
jgi:hypothetical protein